MPCHVGFQAVQPLPAVRCAIMLTQLSSDIAPHCLAATAQVAGFAGSGELIRPLGYYLRRHSQCLTNRERDPYQSSF